MLDRETRLALLARQVARAEGRVEAWTARLGEHSAAWLHNLREAEEFLATAETLLLLAQAETVSQAGNQPSVLPSAPTTPNPDACRSYPASLRKV